MVLAHLYNGLHLSQIEYIINCTQNSKLTLLIPCKFKDSPFLRDLGENVDFIFYNIKDPHSFFSIYRKNEKYLYNILNNVKNVSILYLPDIAYSLNNYIASFYGKQSNLQIILIYDGLLSISNPKLSIKAKIFDNIKYIYSKFYSKMFYIKRAYHTSGSSNDIVSKQLLPYFDKQKIHHPKSVLHKDLFQLPKIFQKQHDIVFVISQDIDLVMDWYSSFFYEMIEYCFINYPKFKIYVLLRDDKNKHSLFYEECYYVKRNHLSETAEEIISRINPKVVISHNSTSLINLKLLNFQGQLISFRPNYLTKRCGHNFDTYCLLRELFVYNNIKICD